MGLNKDFKVKNSACVGDSLMVTNSACIGGDTSIYGNLSVYGDETILRTIISTTSALSVINHGTGPALYVKQAGSNEPIAQFVDHEGGQIIFADSGDVGIGTTAPAEKLTVSGNISASGSLSAAGLSANYFAGRVGIGTVAPEAPLHVNATGGILSQWHRNGTQLVTIGGSSNKGQIRFQYSGDCISTGATTGGDYSIDTGGSVGAGDNMFYVCKAGNVGIGTTAPAEKLTVAGDVSARDGLSAASVTVTTAPRGFVSAGRDLSDIFSPGGTAGGVGGSGTTCYIPVWEGSTCLGNSIACITPAQLTVAGNISALGALSATTEVTVPDDGKIALGNHKDLKICHNGTDSSIFNETGDLYITNAADNKDIIFRSDDGSGGYKTYFYLDGSAERTIFPDSMPLQLGGSASDGDLQLMHDGTDSKISNNVGDLYINQEANDKDIIFQADDGSGGKEVYFLLDGSASSGSPIIKFPDNSNIALGDGPDAYLVHNGTNTVLDNYTGDLIFQNNNNDGDLLLKSDNGYGGITTYIQLDGSKEQVHISTGLPASAGNVGISTSAPAERLTISGNISASGSLSAAGPNPNYFAGNVGIGITSPAEQLTVCGNISASGTIMGLNVPDIGTGTAGYITKWEDANTIGNSILREHSSGLSAFGGLSASGDVHIGNDGNIIFTGGATTDKIQSEASFLVLEGGNVILRKCGGSEDYAKFFGDGSVDLYYNNSKKFGTTNTGVGIFGTLSSASSICTAATTNGFVSAGRDLANVFATAAGNIDGSGTTCYIANFADSNTIQASPAYFDSTQLKIIGSLSATGGICTAATTNGFISAGRDLADIFETCASSVDGSGTANYIPIWSDSDTLGNSILREHSSGLSAFGGLSASGANNYFAGKVGIGGQPGTRCLYVNGYTAAGGVEFISGVTYTNQVRTCALEDKTNSGYAKIAFGGSNCTMAFCTDSTSRMFLNAAGNLGIGTETPYAYNTTATRLHVTNSSFGGGSASEVARFQGTSDADGSGGIIRLGTSNDRGIYLEGGRTGAVPYASIGTTEYDGAKTEGIRIDSAGKIGIGTTAPAEKLTVSGSISSQGYCSDVNSNTKIGTDALDANTTGDQNTALGHCALNVNTTGGCNVAIGHLSLKLNISGDGAVAIGYGAGCKHNIDRKNVYVGYEAGRFTTLGTGATFIGACAGLYNTTGSSNTFIGDQAMQGNTVGGSNVSIGVNSGLYSEGDGGDESVFIGSATGFCNDASYQVMIGGNAGKYQETGANTTAVGYNANRGTDGNTTGYYNTSIGSCANYAITTAGSTVAVGYKANFSGTTASYNTAVGTCALYSNTTGTGNLAIGFCSLFANVTANNNVGVGDQTIRNNTTGYSNVGVGTNALLINTEGRHNQAMGTETLKCNTTGCCNIGIGTEALRTNSSGANNIAIGHLAMYANNTTGSNIAIGSCALFNNTANANTVVGSCAMLTNTSGYYNTALGYHALQDNDSGNNNTAVGHCALHENENSHNTGVGMYALLCNTSGAGNTAMGICGLCKNTSGDAGVAVGRDAAANNTIGDCNVATGYQSLYNNVTGGCLVAIGTKALHANTCEGFSTAIGHETLMTSITGANNTAVGFRALCKVNAIANTAVGTSALRNTTAGTYNEAFGVNALFNNTTGCQNVGIGTHALYSNTTGNNNTAVGNNALRSNTTGTFNTGVGLYAGCNNLTGDCNIMFGYAAGRYLANGSSSLCAPENSTYIGTCTRGNTDEENNAIVIGYCACSCGSNTISLGNANITNAYLNGSLSSNGTITSEAVHVSATTNGFVSAGRDLADIFASSSGNVDGSGTANYIPIWSDSETLGNSILREHSSGLSAFGGLSASGANNYFAGNVGIGTYKPSSLLNLNDANNGDAHQLTFSYESGGTKTDAFTIGRNSSTGNLEFQSDINNHGFEFCHAAAGTQEFNVINMDVGIGTNAPNEKLTVAGTISALGALSATGGVSVPDNGKITSGNHKDLQIYHDGSNSYISDTGTGGLKVMTGDFYVRNPADADMIYASSGGAAKLYHAGSEKLATASGSVDVTGMLCTTDNIRAENSSFMGGREDASAPTYRFHDDGDTGMFNVASDILAFSTGGTEQMRINSTGAVGIGTTSPIATLHVAGSAYIANDTTVMGNLSVHGDLIYIDTSVTVTSALSVINAGTGPALFVAQEGAQPIAHFVDRNGDDIVFADDGKVGIGTYSPAKKLHIVGPDGASGSTSGNSDTALLIDNNGANGAIIELMASNDAKGSIFFTDENAANRGGIIYEHTNDKLKFNTAAATAVTVTSAGNVGIGTTSPARKLNVVGDAEVSTNLVVGTALYTNDWTAGTSGIQYIKNSSGSTSIAIENGGNVGIGTTAPAEKLTVAGNISALGALSAVSGVNVPDSSKITLGNHKDLQIYHDGSNSYINEIGTGDLFICGGNDIIFKDAAGNLLANMNQSNSVELYYGGSKKLETTNTGVGIFGSLSAANSICTAATTNGFVSAGRDLADIFETCSSSVDGSGTANYIPLWSDSDTLGNSLLRQHSSGLSAFGSLSASGANNYFAGNVGIGTGTRVASDPDLKLEINSNTADNGIRITSGNTARHAIDLWTESGSNGGGDLRLYTGVNSIDTRFRGSGSFVHAVCTGSNFGIGTTAPAEKLTVHGNISASGSLSASSGYSYLGDRVAIGCSIIPGYALSLPDNCKIGIGNSGDLRFCHDGSHSYVSADGTGNLYIQQHTADKDIAFQADDSSGSATTYFFLDGSAVDTRVCKNFRFIDNVRAGFGTSMNLNICNDGTHSYIANGANSLYVRTASTIQLENSDGSEDMATFAANGAVSLFHDNVKKFATTSSGVGIFGTLSASDEVCLAKSVYDSPSGENFYRVKFKDHGGIHNDVGIGQCDQNSMGFNITPAANAAFVWYAGTQKERMRLNYEGCLGIGTSSPDHLLDVAGCIRSTDGSNIGIVELGETAQTNKAGGAIRGERSPSYSSTGKVSLQTATWGAGTDYNLTTQLSIENKSADAKAAQVLIAPWGGCVGIGLSSTPARNLSIIGCTTNAILQLGNSSTGTGADTGLELFISDNSAGVVNRQNGYLRFDTNNTERVRIEAAGNVGIGTAAPAEKLTIHGNISASGSLSAGSGYSYLGDRVAIGCNMFPSAGLTMPDTCKISLGSSSDLELYHESGNNWITTPVGGNLMIQSNGLALRSNAQEPYLEGTANGAVALYYDNSKKLGTTTSGVGIFGQLSAAGMVSGTCFGPTNIVTNYVVKFDGTALNDSLIYDTGTNVGISTNAPAEKLTVHGNISASGNGYFACVIAGGYFEEKAASPTLAEYPTGSLVVIGCGGNLELSTKSNDKNVFGVTQNGVCQPIVLGAEPVLVTGDIDVGDFITTSDTPGHGKKSIDSVHGSIIAQAMEAGCGCSYTLQAMIRKM